MAAASGSNARGRPGVTSHADIERAAFELFGSQGFTATTMGAIAERVGVSPRTLFRYYESKNDIPWGQFDETLTHFEQLLARQPSEAPLADAVHAAVVEFNRFPESAAPSHHDRMRLILTTPELQAHSALRYREWRLVIARFVATRTGVDIESRLPRLIAHVSLALALAAYDSWLDQPQEDLPTLVNESLALLRTHLTTP